MEYSGAMSDVQTVPATETTAKPSSPQLPPEEPAATARAETPAATPPAAESSTPPSKTAATPEATAAQQTAAVPEKVEHGIGVLLVNLGTPDAPDAKAVRRYLKQFLTDPRVIEKRGLFWKLILNGFILPIRSRRKARDYKRIWNNDKNESPFKTITRSQAEKLAGILQPLGKHVIVDWAMRYANPSIASRLEALIARGRDRILVMPLYHDYPYYIEVLASSLKAELKGLAFKPDVILLSYHGMPKDCVLKGDPYEAQCVRTTELLRAQLGLDEQKLMMTFQSRFGRARWLEPYTIKTVKALAKKGVKNLVVLTPGFSADCLETLEEIAVENAHVFKRYGGENFTAIPCLNDSEAGMLMIWQLAMRELKGWV